MAGNAVETSFIVIKGRFKAISTNTFGLFLIFFNKSTQTVETLHALASHFSSLYENSPQNPWYDIEEKIIMLKWKGEFATNVTNDVQRSFEDAFKEAGRGEEIYYALSKGQLSKVANIFQNILTKPTGDKNVTVELAVEEITQSDIERVKEEREKRDQEESEEAEAEVQQEEEFKPPEESAVVLEVSLVLSPISGTPIHELHPGDRIMVKISERTTRGQYFIDLFNAIKDGEVVPIPATVVDIKSKGKEVSVVVNLGPSIYGRAIEAANVKVKRFTAEEAQPVQPTKTKEKKTAPSSAKKKESPFKGLLVPFLVGAGVLLLVLLLIYLEII